MPRSILLTTDEGPLEPSEIAEVICELRETILLFKDADHLSLFAQEHVLFALTNLEQASINLRMAGYNQASALTKLNSGVTK